MADKLKVDRPYPELAIELVRRLRAQSDGTLWKRWVELESKMQGIAEIGSAISGFLLANVEAPTRHDMRNLEMAMREIAYCEVKSLSRN